MDAELLVLAGAPGSGKSSLGGALLQSRGLDYFAASDYARAVMSRSACSPDEALIEGWAEGHRRLRAAISSRRSFAIESSLGGVTVPRLIREAAEAGLMVRVWFFGLDSLRLHLHRVRRREIAGGFPAIESHVRTCWTRSRENLIALMPACRAVRLFDNSVERTTNIETPAPRLIMDIRRPDWILPFHQDLASTPDWAKPILESAIAHYGLPAKAPKGTN